MPIKNIILYSNKLPPAHVGGMESNAYYFAKHISQNTNYNLSIVTHKNSKIDLRALFKPNQMYTYGGLNINLVAAQKKEFKKAASAIKIFRKTGFDPSETVIFHNSLNLHHHYEHFKSKNYLQVARSGGNDILFLQNNQSNSKQLIGNFSSLNRLFVNSSYSARRSVETGLPEALIEVVKGGCEPMSTDLKKGRSELGLPSDKLVILTCGRLVDFKGIDDALSALANLKQQGVNFLYAIVGDGELANTLKQKTNALDLNEQVRFFGKLDPHTTLNFYQCADIYLSSSKGIIREANGFRYLHTETMGRSICEAQINGLPVVSTNAGGSSEMLADGETGLVVAEGNINAIATALTKLATDDNYRKTLASNAQTFANKHFAWTKVAGTFLEKIESID